MSNKEISKGNGFLTCENYVPFNEVNIMRNFFKIAYDLKIPLVVIDNMSIQERTIFLQNLDPENSIVTTSQQIYDSLKTENITTNQLKTAYTKFIYSNESLKCLIVTRKTLTGNSIEKIKQQLGSFRYQYEIISFYSDDQTALKWAAQDRRIDYITIEILGNSKSIDQALCSVVKQKSKCFEIIISPLINAKSDRELSEVLRKGRKLMQLITSTNTPFIFTMKPKSPLQLRTGSQMRLLGGLLEVSYNKTKESIFGKQLEILIANTIKLHESYIFEGVKEV